jgi:hypothetical protein
MVTVYVNLHGFQIDGNKVNIKPLRCILMVIKL